VFFIIILIDFYIYMFNYYYFHYILIIFLLSHICFACVHVGHPNIQYIEQYNQTTVGIKFNFCNRPGCPINFSPIIYSYDGKNLLTISNRIKIKNCSIENKCWENINGKIGEVFIYNLKYSNYLLRNTYYFGVIANGQNDSLSCSRAAYLPNNNDFQINSRTLCSGPCSYNGSKCNCNSGSCCARNIKDCLNMTCSNTNGFNVDPVFQYMKSIILTETGNLKHGTDCIDVNYYYTIFETLPGCVSDCSINF